MICGKKISKNLKFNCDMVGGVEAVLYLFNRTEVLGPVRDVTNPQIITDLTMRIKTAGTPNILFTGFKYDGFNNSVKPKSALVKKSAGARYDHTVDFLVFGRGSVVKDELENLANGSVIAVIENVNKNGDNAFEIYGLDVGLEVKTLADDITGADNDGAYALTLGSPDNFKEGHLPATFFDTDYATTSGNLTALISTTTAV